MNTANFALMNTRDVVLMAIVNCTPDSFSDGASVSGRSWISHFVDKALALIEAGAGVLDIGGESTRPGAKAVPDDEELRRVVPVISAIRKRCDIAISVDTRKAEVARQALAAGATIVNDVSGFTFDPKKKTVI